MCIRLIVARQRLGKHVPAATNTHATIEELMNAYFLCGPCLIEGESVSRSVYPCIVVRQQLCNDVPAATKNCWRRRFLCGLCRI
jgi:hypothetical protein